MLEYPTLPYVAYPIYLQYAPLSAIYLISSFVKNKLLDREIYTLDILNIPIVDEIYHLSRLFS